MDEEIHNTQPPVTRKAIPPQRDHLQSLLLVSAVSALLCLLTLDTFYRFYPVATLSSAHGIGAIAISAAFFATVLILRAATPAGAACGGILCLLITLWTGTSSESLLRSGLTPLATLFVLTFLATRAGRQRKALAGLAEKRKGRTAAQIIANLSIAALSIFVALRISLIAVHPGIYTATITLKLMCLAALIEATADTVSSEIGQAFGGGPILVSTLRRVAPGTNGAITLLGTAAGILAGAIVTLAGAWALHLGYIPASIALAAGIAGLFFDSLLGATVERKGWLGNDLVNFASTAFAAIIAAAAHHVL